MIIKLKLVGTNEETNININDKDRFKDSEIFTYLIENNLSYDEVSKIKIFNNGRTILNDPSNISIVADGIIPIFHIYTTEPNIKSELIKHIFNKSNDVESDILESINKHNEEIIKLFSDHDFTYLLKICLTKPDLINKVSGYLLNGNITTEIKNINNDDFKYDDIYDNLIEMLNSLNINKDENIIKSVIQHFEGNINLSLRYLLTN